MKREPTVAADQFAHDVIAAALEVHKNIGPGYLESVYEEALGVELQLRCIPFERQRAVSVNYKGHHVGEGRIDLLVGGCLVVELKSVDSLAPIHTAQMISYLKSTRIQLGLLINFNVRLLKDGIKRIVLS